MASARVVDTPTGSLVAAGSASYLSISASVGSGNISEKQFKILTHFARLEFMNSHSTVPFMGMRLRNSPVAHAIPYPMARYSGPTIATAIRVNEPWMKEPGHRIPQRSRGFPLEPRHGFLVKRDRPAQQFLPKSSWDPSRAVGPAPLRNSSCLAAFGQLEGDPFTIRDHPGGHRYRHALSRSHATTPQCPSTLSHRNGSSSFAHSANLRPASRPYNTSDGDRCCGRRPFRALALGQLPQGGDLRVPLAGDPVEGLGVEH